MKESVFLVKEVIGIYCRGSNVLLVALVMFHSICCRSCLGLIGL